MPVFEPTLYKVLTTNDLLAARELLWSKRMTGLQYVRYADGSSNGYKSDAEISTILGAIDRELALRQGTSAPSTIRIASEKGLA